MTSGGRWVLLAVVIASAAVSGWSLSVAMQWKPLTRAAVEELERAVAHGETLAQLTLNSQAQTVQALEQAERWKRLALDYRADCSSGLLPLPAPAAPVAVLGGLP